MFLWPNCDRLQSYAEEKGAFGDGGGYDNDGVVIVNGVPFWVDPELKLPLPPVRSTTDGERES